MSKTNVKPEDPAGKVGASELEEVTLSFDLFDLPTTHHKAGLVGLLMVIDSMRDGKRPNAPLYADLTTTSVKVTFTAESTQALFDYLYEAKRERIWSPSKWPGAEPLDVKQEETIDPKTKKPKKAPKFLYEVVEPQAPFLRRHLKAENGAWLKIWRNMVWTIPRGINTTRVPFNQRADGGPCAEGAATWRGIVEFKAGLDLSTFATAPISSALMLAAQSENAESVRFLGRIDQNLLLHFWQAVVMTYVPCELDDEGKTKAVGFTLALPDVADLHAFKRAFPQFLGQLGDAPHPQLRSRPAGAVIDVPAESSLEFLRHLSELTADKSELQSWFRSVSAVDSFHMLKSGNNIKLQGFARVDGSRRLISEYVKIKQLCLNPTFRATLLRNLLADRPWHAGMLDLFARRPSELFVTGEKTPRFVPRFGADAQAKFRLINEEYQTVGDDEDLRTAERNRLSRIVWNLIREHLDRRTEIRSRQKIKDFPKKEYISKDGKTRETRDYPKDFREKMQSVCSELFLTMRSRHDRDFIETFVGTIAASPQNLPIEDYQYLTTVLLRPSPKDAIRDASLCWEDVKAMAMLAVSARSSALRPLDERAKADAESEHQTISEGD